MKTSGDLRHLTSEEIQDLLDQGLPPSEDARVQEHLSSCVRCRSEVEAWSLLFSELGSLSDLAPGPDFSSAVLQGLPERKPLGSRLRGWLAARVPGKTASGHLTPEGMQEYLDQILSGPGRARVEAHLASCTPCRREVSAWGRVFGSLAAVGRIAPSPGFSQGVMAQVRTAALHPVPAPRAAPASGLVPMGLLIHRVVRGIPAVLGRGLALARRALPRTRRAWAIAGGVASAPTITLMALAYLVFSRPLLTAGAFLSYTSWKASALVGSFAGILAERVLESATVFRIYGLMETLAVSPLLLGVGGLVFSLLCGISVWILHRNLLVAPSDEGYAHVRV